ncbi:Raf kinase inhibitor-like YbhB/YbcL family protein [Actimicrobium sp. GrIS 1.19]|uniref:YbhB/YbcL family Raf kinase inhibitor-like protein n=1 Tax=Actimicrobium sp. GrIS 1.19 TaxID=3071708 RepID=UPI002E092DBA|nr:Raf kinase inhibitor-like YbhB/YbcL family protein [Actimicrobium sp. GrIS 1.19]
MKLWSNSFRDGGYIPGEFALCTVDPTTHVTMSANRSPHLAWNELPDGTRSLVLICVDPDVPSVGEDVNQEGRMVPPDLPRVNFYHWVMIDIPPGIHSMPAGHFSEGVTSHGKLGPQISDAVFGAARQGLNDYTGWFADDAAMAGEYFGYDGPCPPWNDSEIHRYVFTLYALDVERLPVEGSFTGPQVLAAMAAHVLDEARVVGIYTLNPALQE